MKTLLLFALLCSAVVFAQDQPSKPQTPAISAKPEYVPEPPPQITSDQQAALDRLKALAGNYESFQAAQDAQQSKYAAIKSKCHVDYVFPTVGMTEGGVYCLWGEPDHVNDDDLGDKQLVYGNSLYVYISHETGLVVDVQTSY